jgi:hypothetical protein
MPLVIELRVFVHREEKCVSMRFATDCDRSTHNQMLHVAVGTNIFSVFADPEDLSTWERYNCKGAVHAYEWTCDCECLMRTNIHLRTRVCTRRMCFCSLDYMKQPCR